MHRIVCTRVRGVDESFDHDVRTCRHVVGELFSRHHAGGTRGLDGMCSGRRSMRCSKRLVLYKRLVRHCPAVWERLDNSGREAATHVRAWCVVGWGGDLMFGHEQLVKFELSFGNRVCGQQCAL